MKNWKEVQELLSQCSTYAIKKAGHAGRWLVKLASTRVEFPTK